MTSSQIIRLRLINQQICNAKFTETEELVSWMGCMQAQDYAMAKWAIGCRLENATDGSVERDFSEGKILRTHILRPTWHFVSPKDIRWILKLTAANIKAFTKSHHQKLGIDHNILKRSKKIIQKALANAGRLNRKELQVQLNKVKINTDDTRISFLLMDAESDGLICSAGKKGNQFAYGLLNEIVPKYKLFTTEESIAELTQRYFTSHGPATIYDFSWWSGLSIADVRQGLEMNKSVLLSENTNGQTYWFANTFPTKLKSTSICLLPAFDEYFISYKDRSVLIEPSLRKEIMTVNGIFNPIIVQNGKIIGTWKRTAEKDKILIEPKLFNANGKSLSRSIVNCSKRYGKFIGRDIKIII